MVGLVFQFSRLLPTLTIAENVMLHFGENSSIDLGRYAARDHMERELADMLEDELRTLEGGYARKITQRSRHVSWHGHGHGLKLRCCGIARARVSSID
jgi:ABC-type lipoprotein export system ATPase subunit